MKTRKSRIGQDQVDGEYANSPALMEGPPLETHPKAGREPKRRARGRRANEKYAFFLFGNEKEKKKPARIKKEKDEKERKKKKKKKKKKRGEIKEKRYAPLSS